MPPVDASFPLMRVRRGCCLKLSLKHVLFGLGNCVESWKNEGDGVDKWERVCRVAVFTGSDPVTQLICLPTGHVLAVSGPWLAIIHSQQLHSAGCTDLPSNQIAHYIQPILHVECHQAAKSGVAVVVWSRADACLVDCSMSDRLECVVLRRLIVWPAPASRVFVSYSSPSHFECAVVFKNTIGEYSLQSDGSSHSGNITQRTGKDIPVFAFDDDSSSWLSVCSASTRFALAHLPNKRTLIVADGDVIRLFSIRNGEMHVRWSEKAPFAVSCVGAAMEEEEGTHLWLGGVSGERGRLRLSTDIGGPPREVRRTRIDNTPMALAILDDGFTLIAHQHGVTRFPALCKSKADEKTILDMKFKWVGRGEDIRHVRIQTVGWGECRPHRMEGYESSGRSDWSHLWPAEGYLFTGKEMCRTGFNKKRGALATGVRTMASHRVVGVLGVRSLFKDLVLAAVRLRYKDEDATMAYVSHGTWYEVECMGREGEKHWWNSPLKAACGVYMGAGERLIVCLRGDGVLCQFVLREWHIGNTFTGHRAHSPAFALQWRGRKDWAVLGAVDVGCADWTDKDKEDRTMWVVEECGRVRRLQLEWSKGRLWAEVGKQLASEQLPLDWAYHFIDGDKFVVGVSKSALVVVQTVCGGIVMELNSPLAKQLTLAHSLNSRASVAWCIARVDNKEKYHTPATFSLQYADPDATNPELVVTELALPCVVVDGWPKSMVQADRLSLSPTQHLRVVNVGAHQVALTVQVLDSDGHALLDKRGYGSYRPHWDEPNGLDRQAGRLAVYLDREMGGENGADRTVYPRGRSKKAQLAAREQALEAARQRRGQPTSRCVVYGVHDADASGARALAVGCADADGVEWIGELPDQRQQPIDVLMATDGTIQWIQFTVMRTDSDFTPGHFASVATIPWKTLAGAVERSGLMDADSVSDLFSDDVVVKVCGLECRTMGRGENKTLRMVIILDIYDREMVRAKQAKKKRQGSAWKDVVETRRVVSVFDVDYAVVKAATWLDRKTTECKMASLRLKTWHESIARNGCNTMFVMFTSDDCVVYWSELEGGPVRCIHIRDDCGCDYTPMLDSLVDVSCVGCVESRQKPGAYVVCIGGVDRNGRGRIEMGYQIGSDLTAITCIDIPSVNGKAARTTAVFCREVVVPGSRSVLWVVSQQSGRNPFSVHHIHLEFGDEGYTAVGQPLHSFDLECAIPSDRSRLCHLLPTDSSSICSLEGVSVWKRDGQSQKVQLCRCQKDIVNKVEKAALDGIAPPPYYQV